MKMNVKTEFINKAKNYALSQHYGTNHKYDGYLPYEYHLRSVVAYATKYKHLCADIENAICACWMHDLIEDCRVTYNDVAKNSDNDVAEIVRAVTNNSRGRNRKERMTDECYADIISVPNALFVKLCDRLANVSYSAMTKSRMFDLYKKEHTDFTNKLKGGDYKEMWEELDFLLGT